MLAMRALRQPPFGTCEPANTANLWEGILWATDLFTKPVMLMIAVARKEQWSKSLYDSSNN